MEVSTASLLVWEGGLRGVSTASLLVGEEGWIWMRESGEVRKGEGEIGDDGLCAVVDDVGRRL